MQTALSWPWRRLNRVYIVEFILDPDSDGVANCDHLTVMCLTVTWLMLTYMYGEEVQPGAPTPKGAQMGSACETDRQGCQRLQQGHPDSDDMLLLHTHTHTHTHTHLQVLGLDTADGFNKHQDSSFPWWFDFQSTNCGTLCTLISDAIQCSRIIFCSCYNCDGVGDQLVPSAIQVCTA